MKKHKRIKPRNPHVAPMRLRSGQGVHRSKRDYTRKRKHKDNEQL